MWYGQKVVFWVKIRKKVNLRECMRFREKGIFVVSFLVDQRQVSAPRWRREQTNIASIVKTGWHKGQSWRANVTCDLNVTCGDKVNQKQISQRKKRMRNLANS